MLADNVVRIFSNEDKQEVLWFYNVLGEMFFINASRMACRTLAAAFRDMSREYPDVMATLLLWAQTADERAKERRRVYYPHELVTKLYYTTGYYAKTPASV